ncbi:FKBP-type peptidyl-prolyl cis-trans isomerase [Endothiovibrio diazotrophicus]
MSDVVEAGAQVTLHLRIALESGAVAEESFGKEPLTFTIGDGTMIEGLEKLLIGLKVGEQANFLVAPRDAFGMHDPDKVHLMERTEFPLAMSEQLQPGQLVAFHTPAGDEMLGMIKELTIDRVEVDFNHPLAGRTIRFEVEILKVGS